MAEGWEVVAEVETEDEALLMAGFLSNADVPSEVESASSHEFPVPLGDLALVKLWVPGERLEEARRLLQERELAPPGESDPGEEGEP